MYEFTIALTACTRPVQNQAIQNPSMEEGNGHQVSPLSEKLLVTDGCWEKGSQLVSRVWPLGGYP